MPGGNLDAWKTWKLNDFHHLIYATYQATCYYTVEVILEIIKHVIVLITDIFSPKYFGISYGVSYHYKKSLQVNEKRNDLILITAQSIVVVWGTYEKSIYLFYTVLLPKSSQLLYTRRKLMKNRIHHWLRMRYSNRSLFFQPHST